MKIAVLSDTHFPAPSDWLRAVYDRHLADADVLLHCGDATGCALWSFFGQHPRFHAVAGNSDEWRLAEELPSRLILDLDGLRVGLVHGWGDRSTLAERVVEDFGPGVDLVCFGHLHQFSWRRRGGAWALNPGSLREKGEDCSLAVVHYQPGDEPTVERITDFDVL